MAAEAPSCLDSCLRFHCAFRQRAPPHRLLALLRRAYGVVHAAPPSHAAQAALADLLDAPPVPLDADWRRRLLREAALAAEAQGNEVSEELMDLLAADLLGRLPDGDEADDEGGDGGSAARPPPPQPGWCYKLWSYAPEGEAPGRTLQTLAALEEQAKQARRWASSGGGCAAVTVTGAPCTSPACP